MANVAETDDATATTVVGVAAVDIAEAYGLIHYAPSGTPPTPSAVALPRPALLYLRGFMAPTLEWIRWAEQAPTWPSAGEIIMAAADNASITVYQAYNDAIADAAVVQQNFLCPAFSLRRTSWIKPNFLWMAARSGWGTKPAQTRTLAVTLTRPFFDSLLASAVATVAPRGANGTATAEWRAALRASPVVVQWDPDHLPRGGRHPTRRAVQLGLRGIALRRYAAGVEGGAVVHIADVTARPGAERTISAALPDAWRVQLD
ncbi:hypothetical protein MMPV_007068 [Pyropia vietnamensis]